MLGDKRSTRRTFTESEISYLRRNSKNHTIDELAKALARTKNSTRTKLKGLGLEYIHKSPGPKTNQSKARESKRVYRGGNKSGKDASDVDIGAIVKRGRAQRTDIETVEVGDTGKRYKIETYVHNQRKQLVRKGNVKKGTLENIYARHFSIRYDNGLLESFLKADIITGFIKLV